METAWTKTCQGLKVAGRSIAFVDGEIISRAGLIQSRHQPVPRYLGNDGCGGYGDRDGITMDKTDLMGGMLDLDGIKEQSIRAGFQLENGYLHGKPTRLENIDAVDFLFATMPTPTARA